MYLVIGLGNPGQEYQNTRHNFGWEVLHALSPDWHFNKKFKAETAELNSGTQKIVLAKPQTFMNNSGVAVQALVNYFKIPIKDVYVFQDELDLKCGDYKIQTNRSSAGHNGIASIIELLGTQEFTRIRIGIGKEDKEKQGKGADYVLSKFSLIERLKLKEVKKKILEEMHKLLSLF